MCMAFPGVEVGLSYGMSAYLVNGRFFTRLREEDQSLILMEIPIDERELLLAAEPEVFHITDHYRNYPTVLARIEGIHPAQLRGFLERRWRRIAPKRLQKARERGEI